MVAVVMMVPATGSNYDFTFATIVVIVMVCVLWTRTAPAGSSIAFNVAAALRIGFSRSA